MTYITVKKHTVRKALSMGFEKVFDDRDYDAGAYYIKDGKKWIFDINALKQKQNIFSDNELKELGYDVDTYKSVAKELDEMSIIYQDIVIEDGEAIYLEGGMYLYPDGSIR
ncbi:hypothetical protein ABN306_19865 [Providencia huaxiensis]|uniref:hypothetical protein n=1 Tax=Providencia huaxiensis TaxID=2027290 RepID=UPI0032DB22FC